MKTLIKTKKVILISLFTLTIFSFTMINLTQEEEAIIGTWINTETPEWKFEFKTDGKCYDYYNNQLEDTFSYSITQENSKNGKLTLSYLKLVNIKKSSEVMEYEINSLGENKMCLDYLGDKGTKLIYFTKE